MTKGSPKKSSFSTARRLGAFLNVVLSIAAASALLVMVNFLGIRHFQRRHVGGLDTAELTPVTRQLVDSLTNELKVTLFFDPDASQTSEALYKYSNELLKEYQALSTNVVLRTVDYLRDPGTAGLIKQQYEISYPGHRNMIIFDYGGKVRTVHAQELSDYAPAGYENRTNLVFKRVAFKGEQLFTSAILSLTEPYQPKAFFLQGHQEHDPESTGSQEGYSRFATLLRHNNLELEKLWLSGTNTIPDNCSLLIIAGPKTTIHELEARKIENYLGRGGRLLALLRSQPVTGLEVLMAQWGVVLGDDLVIDPPNSVGGPQDMAVTNFTSHPVVAPLHQSQLYLVLPRSVTPASSPPAGADAPQVDVLFRTGVNGQAMTEIAGGVARQRTPSQPGPIPLAVAVEKGAIPGVSANHGTTRMVVVGESLFLGNTGIYNYSNEEFANLAVNWLLDRSLLVDIGPRPVREYRLSMTQQQKHTATWVLLAGIPGSVLVVGFLVWLVRRR